MDDPPSILFITRFYWPELIGSAPFSTDIAEWLAAHGRPTTVVSGLPHYPHTDIFPAYRNGRCLRETVCNVDVERLRAGPQALYVDVAHRFAKAPAVPIGRKDVGVRVVRQTAHHRGRPPMRCQPFGDVGTEGR